MARRHTPRDLGVRLLTVDVASLLLAGAVVLFVAAIVVGMTLRAVRAPRGQRVRAAFGPKTRGIVVNSPHNPSGKVFTRPELGLIADLCREFDAIAFTDDIYEHLVYDGEHVPLATLPGMAERTVSIHSMSKTYSVTGWRIGWAIAAADLSLGIRRVHDFLTVGAAAMAIPLILNPIRFRRQVRRIATLAPAAAVVPEGIRPMLDRLGLRQLEVRI